MLKAFRIICFGSKAFCLVRGLLVFVLFAPLADLKGRALVQVGFTLLKLLPPIKLGYLGQFLL